MTTYQMNNYNICLKLNNLLIVDTISKRVFQCELNYKDFILCDNDEDLYDLLNEKLLDKNISFELVKDYLVGSLKISISTTKFKEIKFEIPETVENKDMIQIIELQKIQIDLLTDKIIKMENKMNSILFFEMDQSFINSNIESLWLGRKSSLLMIGNDGTSTFPKGNGYPYREYYNKTLYTISTYLPNINSNRKSYSDKFNEIQKIEGFQKLLFMYHNVEDPSLMIGNDHKYIEQYKFTKTCYNDILNFRLIKMYNNNDLINLQKLNKLKILIISPNCDKYFMERLMCEILDDNHTYTELNYISDTLEFLELCELTNINDITFCKKLKNLKTLLLIDCPNIEDISCLKDCPNLVYLKISGTTKIVNTIMLTNPKLQIIK